LFLVGCQQGLLAMLQDRAHIRRTFLLKPTLNANKLTAWIAAVFQP
jgi:hypothetical protein